MNYDAYHNSPRELARVADLLNQVPSGTGSVLDIGARDGHITRLLADRVGQVVALDLTLPSIDDPRIECVAGNAAALPFPDASFDLVFCAEVLEHIPSPALDSACREIARVAKQHVLIGVPYRQDIRRGRTTCRQCGGVSPPWGHVNSFDEARLRQLFPPVLAVSRTTFVGTPEPGTNALSTWLSDLAGNPYGTYDQDERCVHCGSMLLPPPRLSFMQRLLTRLAREGDRLLSSRGQALQGNWIHVLMCKQ